MFCSFLYLVAPSHAPLLKIWQRNMIDNSTFGKVGNNGPTEATIRDLWDPDKWGGDRFGYVKWMIRRRSKEKVIGREEEWDVKGGWLRAGDSGPGRLKPEKSIGGESWSCRRCIDNFIRNGIQSRLRVRCLMERTNLRSRAEGQGPCPRTIDY